ncbi:MAG: hypothetical protein N3A63_00840 [Bacteroidetes bacterium]|nr:hypothetical protein [Bacteroidota bacterium]
MGLEITSSYGQYSVVWASIEQIRMLLNEPCVTSIRGGTRHNDF